MAHMEAVMLPRPAPMAHLPLVMLLVGTAHQEVGTVPPIVAMAMAIAAMAIVAMDVQTVTAPQEGVAALLREAVAMATMPPTVEATKTVRASPLPCS